MTRLMMVKDAKGGGGEVDVVINGQGLPGRVLKMQRFVVIVGRLSCTWYMRKRVMKA